MGRVFAYDHHNGWDDMVFLTDHRLSDIERFCRLCEDWDELIKEVESKDDLLKIIMKQSIPEGSDEYKILINNYDKYSATDYIRPAFPPEKIEVGVFFFAEGNFAFWGSWLSTGRTIGDMVVYKQSHYEVWSKSMLLRYNAFDEEVGYDYYPHGRVEYRISDDTFLIYYDKCLEGEINRIADAYQDYEYILISE